MRIAVFHELHEGGARRSVNELAKRLKKKHVVDLYSTDADTKIAEKKNYTDSFFFPFSEVGWYGHNKKVKFYKDTFELLKLLKLHRQIAKQIDQKNYDLAFIHPSKFTQAPFILRFLKTKSVYYCQEPLRMVYEDVFTLPKEMSFLSRRYESANRSIRKQIDKENISNAKVLMCNSKFSATAIRKAYRKKSTVCYLGVDSHFFKPLRLKKTIDILFLGSKDHVDGFDLFEKARQHLPQAIKMVVVESFLKRVSDRELVKLYNSAKIVVALAIDEPFGLIPLEAMACGTPVVAINQGGYKETVIDERTGFLIPRRYTFLVNRIRLLLGDEKMRMRMGERAREDMIKNWTWEGSAKKIEREFLKVV